MLERVGLWFRETLKAAVVVVLFAFSFIPVTLVLEKVVGLECKSVYPITLAIICIGYVFGYLLPIEMGIKYRRP